MEQSNERYESKIESDKFTDIAYETKIIGLLEGLNASKERVRSEQQITHALRHTLPDTLDKIRNIEKTSKVFIFKRLKTIISIETTSPRQDQISVIFPSGSIDSTSPTSSKEEGDSVYRNIYTLESSCIGISIPRNCEIQKITAVTLSEQIRNLTQIKNDFQRSKRNLSLVSSEKREIDLKIEIAQKRLSNLNLEIENSEKNLNHTNSISIEKENQILELENHRQRIIEEKTDLENSLEKIKSDIDNEKNKKDELEKIIKKFQDEINSNQISYQALASEINNLEQKKNLFDNELAGYSTEGKNQVKIYLLVSSITLTLLLVSTFTVINSGADLIRNSYGMDMIDILISRIPLTIGLSLIISMSFALSYFMIKQSISINLERMKFMQASIIAKDMWSSVEKPDELSTYEREKLRQQAKIQLIGKIFENNTFHLDSKYYESLIEKILKKE